MTTQWNELAEAIENQNLPALQSLLQSGNAAVFDETFQLLAIFQRQSVTEFLCVQYPDKTLDTILTEKCNYRESVLSKFAEGTMCCIPIVLDNLETHLLYYMEKNPTKRELFQCILNACVIIICERRYEWGTDIESVDNVSMTVIDTLKKFGASPSETSDNPKWYTHTYDNVLEKLSQRSTRFIEYMAQHINYHTCLKKGKNMFQLLLESWSFEKDSTSCESLLYLIKYHHFDVCQMNYESGNVLHRIHRLDVLVIVLPILESKQCLTTFMWQPDANGKTPIDIHMKFKEFIAAFQHYDTTVQDYVTKKTPRKRGSAIDIGCKLYYSETHAKQETTVLKFISPDNVAVLCTWKSFPDEDGSEYPFTDKQLGGVLHDGWTCYGTQCSGFHALGRCNEFIPLKEGNMNSCIPCWNRMRDLLG